MEYPLPLVDLRQFGDRYLIRASEEYDGRKKIPDDPFFQATPCRRDMSIWPYGEEKLGVTVHHRYVDKLLATGVILEDESAIAVVLQQWTDRLALQIEHPRLAVPCARLPQQHGRQEETTVPLGMVARSRW